jgi:hypothetical protein
MPGAVFADPVRTGPETATENEPDLGPVFEMGQGFKIILF